MHTELFVKSIRQHVRDAAVEDTITKLRKPPGRRALTELKARSNWYNNLSEIDSEFVQCIIASAVDEAIFGLFAALDGSRVISDGRFELFHVNERRVLLNDPNGIGLNEVFNSAD